MEIKKTAAQILGCLLLLTSLVTMYVIDPIAKKMIKWIEIPEITWVVYAMLAGLGAGALMASEDTGKHRLVFTAIFLTVVLNIIMQIMFIYKKYDGDMIQAGLNIIYLSIAAGLALWIGKKS